MKLYLASQSASRQQLLKEAQIPFETLSQSADESACDWNQSLKQVVLSISLHKMEHVELPVGQEGETILVLTGDTLNEDSDGSIEGKPSSRDDAICKLKKAREGSVLYSAFCLDKKLFRDGAWQTTARIHKAVKAEYKFIVPDKWIERYLKHSPGLSTSSAIAVELYGLQFLKQVSGSYSTIVGLPMYELREALEELNFFSL